MNVVILVKVMFVVLHGSKVHIEINTAKRDAFMYNPLWDQPQIQVNVLSLYKSRRVAVCV